MDFPNTKSDSGAELKEMSVKDYNASNRITESSKTGVLGDMPINVKEKKVPKMDVGATEDFSSKKSGESGNSPLDGMKEIEPYVAKPNSKITTEFSKR